MHTTSARTNRGTLAYLAPDWPARKGTWRSNVAPKKTPAPRNIRLTRPAGQPNSFTLPGDMRSVYLMRVALALPAQIEKIPAPSTTPRAVPLETINHNIRAQPPNAAATASHIHNHVLRSTGGADGASEPAPPGNQCRRRYEVQNTLPTIVLARLADTRAPDITHARAANATIPAIRPAVPARTRTSPILGSQRNPNTDSSFAA